MNKSVILNCKNHGKDGCRLNDKGDCKLSHISLAKAGSLRKSHMICEDFEEIPEKENDVQETKKNARKMDSGQSIL